MDMGIICTTRYAIQYQMCAHKCSLVIVTVSDRPDREIFYATDVAAAAGIGAVIVLAIAVVLVYCMCKKMRANMRSELRAAEKSMFEVGKQAGTNINLQMTPSMRTGWCLACTSINNIVIILTHDW